MNYVFLAPGFEEIEAVTPIDVMRRAGMDVTTVSVTDDLVVVGAHGVGYVADAVIDNAGEMADAEWIVLPGGMPGAANLHDCPKLMNLVSRHLKAGKKVAAICAAPAVVLGQEGQLDGRHATCYPGFEELCKGAVMESKPVVIDGNLLTGWGPSAALPWSYAIIGDKAAEVSEGMLFDKTFGK